MKNISPVDLSKAYRLINHGPTVLVSSRFGGVDNVMAAAWSSGLDYNPSKVTVVIDSQTKTRDLVDKSGLFALQVPTVLQARLTHQVGTTSLKEDPKKLEHAGLELFEMPGFDIPLVEGCSAWLACRVVPEPHIQETYDLFIGDVIGAWADPRVFKDGHWIFEKVDPSLRSLHYIAGGHFYTIGDVIDVLN